MINVKNSSRNSVRVSINIWSENGKTSRFSISPGGTEDWNRNDRRGFVMTLERPGAELPYYVLPNSDIDISDSTVKDHGEEISPINRATVLLGDADNINTSATDDQALMEAR